jgi:predicted transposase/invertase (TIGR01784 family)
MKTINTHEPEYRLNPLNDFLFYKVMGEKGDEVQLISFLNAVLGRTGEECITAIEIMENKSFVADILNGKSCVLDVRAVLSNRTKVNIEVQLRNQHNMDRRSLFYWSNMFSEDMKEGQDYRKLPNVIAINIVDFDYLPGGNYHTCFRLREDTDTSFILTGALEIHFIDMVKWRKRGERDMEHNPLDRWLVWFDSGSPPELVAEVVKMDSGIMAANEKQEYTSQDKEARRHYWRRQMAEMDLRGTNEYARAEGLQEGQRKIIELLKSGKSPEDIIREYS